MRRPVDDVPLHADLRGLDRLVAEVHALSRDPEQRPRLVHALRNLAHVASLLADVLKNDASGIQASSHATDARE